MPPFKKNNNNGGNPPNVNVPIKAFEITSPNCKICNSPNRAQIERCITLGLSIAEICRQFEDSDALTRENVKNHRNRHLAVEKAAIRQIVEQRAKEFNEDVENTTNYLLTRKAYMEAAMLKSYQAIVEDRVTPEPRDIVQMINVMEKWEKENATQMMDEMMRDINALTIAIKEVVPPELYDRILERFEYHVNSTKPAMPVLGLEMPDSGKDL